VIFQTLILCDLNANYEIGLMALPRSPLQEPNELEEKEAQDIVDTSMLPPG
jgi:hypothetical protein